MKFKMDKVNVIKIVGTVAGLAVTLAANWVSDKETDRKLEKIVSEHLSKKGES